MEPNDPAERSCLERTRSGVLNVLVAVGIGIALSGLVLRGRDRAAAWRASGDVRKGLLATLLAIAVGSHLTRRIGCGRGALRDPLRRDSRFYRAHLLSAVIGASAVPLGLVYGWMVGPRLDAVIPFWVAALGLGVLALPRAVELEGFDLPIPPTGEPNR